MSGATPVVVSEYNLRKRRVTSGAANGADSAVDKPSSGAQEDPQPAGVAPVPGATPVAAHVQQVDLKPAATPKQQELQEGEGAGTAVVQGGSTDKAMAALQVDNGQAAWTAQLRHAATHPGLLIPSRFAFYALLLLPALGWCVAVGSGAGAFVQLPLRKRDVHHFMLWFDFNIFRTVAGPCLPFLMLLIRYLAITPRNRLEADASSGAQGVLAAGHDSSSGRSRVLVKWAAQASRAVRGMRGTHMRQALLIYSSVALLRLAVYLAHLVLQASLTGARREKVAAAATVPHTYTPVTLMSDHLLLGASVVACLHMELICAVSDSIKLASRGGVSMLREFVAASAVVCSALLCLCVCLDMHFTARYYHETMESLVAVGAGILLFQGPTLTWCAHQWLNAQELMPV